MELPSAELYIRWLQANILLPMQMSIPPWRYASMSNQSGDVLYTARRIFKVRRVLAKLLIKALEEARVDHMPIARPLWMNYDHYDDHDVLGVLPLLTDDEYMVGECLLVAPILEEGKLNRNVVFPEGEWIPCMGGANRTPVITSQGNLTILVRTLSIIDDPPCFRRSDIADCSL